MISAIQHLRTVLEEDKIRWVQPANMHITLAFIGDLEELQINNISKKIQNLASDINLFKYSVEKLGVFKSIQNPTVIWFGIKVGDIAQLLKSRIDLALKESGINTEIRSFKPHLTIGRAKFINNKDKLHDLLNTYNDMVFLEDEVKEIILYESILKPDGPTYVELGKFKLA
jgi:2'-5' RNA ligase